MTSTTTSGASLRSHAHLTNAFSSRAAIVRVALGALLLLVALNAFGGGVYGMTGARDIPIAWLVGSPFHSYFVPSVILFVVVGGAFLAAGVGVIANAWWSRVAAFACVLIVLAWLAVETALVGSISFLQPATAIVALIILVLALARQPAKTRRSALWSSSSSESTRAVSGSAFVGFFARRLADPDRVRVGLVALTSTAIAYGLCILLLALGGDRPGPAPWLAISVEHYFEWEAIFIVPCIIACGLLASAVLHLVARAFGGRATFEDSVALVGVAIAISTLCSLVPDLVVATLLLTGAMTPATWFAGTESWGPILGVVWLYLLAYCAAFLVTFSAVARVVHGLSVSRAIGVGAVAFAVYQGVLYIFVR